MAEVTAFSTPQEIDEYIKANYPDVAAFAQNDEAIRWILYDAAVNDRDALEIQSAIRRTAYWQSHGPTSRAVDLLIGTDKKAWEQVSGSAGQIVSDLFARNGITLDQATLDGLVMQSLRSGDIGFQASTGQVFIADQDGLNSLVAFGLGRAAGDLPAGEAQFNSDQFRQIARTDYLLPLTQREADEWAVRALNGQTSEEAFRAEMQARAVERYDWLNLGPGQTVRSKTDGLVATIADTLELDPDDIDLMDPRYKGVLEFYDTKAEKYRGMTLGEAASWARGEDNPDSWRGQAFKNTRTYKQADAEIQTNLLRWLGKAA